MNMDSSKRIGRPSSYTPEIAIAICQRLADGESLRRICRDEHMPDKVTVWRWLDSMPDFRTQYARAREVQAEGFFEEIIEIADDGRRDYVLDEDGSGLINQDHIQRAKLRVDARKWVAARMAPKKYGDPGRNMVAMEPEDKTPRLIDKNADIP